MPTCTAITRNGTRCTKSTSDASGHCEHHQQMNRLLKLAGKSLPKAKVVEKAPVERSTEPGYLPGEVQVAKINCTFDFLYQSGLSGVPGALIISNYRLYFQPARKSSSPDLHHVLRDAIQGLPCASVQRIGYPQTSKAATHADAIPTHVQILFKDLRLWSLRGDIHALTALLQSKIFVHSPASLFAFAKGNRTTSQEREVEGHFIYNIHQDFHRMGQDLMKGPFRITDVNQNYTLCPTYPKLFVVPAAMSDSAVRSVAEFRSKGRMPILSWVHGNGASLWRCAQPKRGILNAHNHDDTEMLALIGRSNPTSSKVWILDARPELNARANNFTGGGTESSSIRHAKVSFMNIANIHAMRDSINSIRALVTTGSSEADFNWLTRIEETKWLYHVRLVLSASLRAAQAINNLGQTVIVHCSDGWDRTGQICALTQLLVDPYYRTLTGFMQIIEKEWIQVGHKFNDRIGPGCVENDQQSPVFLQFLDCCSQLLRLYPTWFEFNAKAIECVADHLISARFGTFLCNCDRERATLDISNRTPSLWAYMNQNRDAMFINHFYCSNDMPLLPHVSTVLRQVTLWSEYYFRGCPVPSFPESNLQATVVALKNRIQTLEAEMSRVEK